MNRVRLVKEGYHICPHCGGPGCAHCSWHGEIRNGSCFNERIEELPAEEKRRMRIKLGWGSVENYNRHNKE